MKRALRLVVLSGLFALPFVPLYVAPSMLYPYVSGKGFAFRMITEVIFAAWILLVLGDRSYRPRGSALLWALLAFVIVIGTADLLGVDPSSSFWGDIVRMDGYLSLLHWLAFFLVAGSFLAREELGDRFLGVTCVASTIVCLYGLVELVQNFAAGQPTKRLEATFGNPTFLGTYVLMQFFILVFLTVRMSGAGAGAARAVSHPFWGLPARLLIGLHLAILFLSGTRGAILGLVAGGALAILIAASLERRSETSRSSAREAVGALIIVLVGFFLLEVSSGLTSWSALTGRADSGAASEASGGGPSPGSDDVAVAVDPATGEVGDLSLFEVDDATLANEGIAGRALRRLGAPLRRMVRIGTGGSVQIRLALWEMAQAGFWERPFTGWGQENFDVLADRYYLASFPSDDEWADRPHNTVLEWFVNGGVAGGLAYLAIFVAAGWLIWRPTAAAGPGSVSRHTEPADLSSGELEGVGLSVTEKGILSGFLVAYLFSNLFLFDMVPSYLVYFSVLAYLHASATRLPKAEERPGVGSPALWAVVLLLLFGTAWALYRLNVRPILAARAGRRAVALVATRPPASLDEFRRALAYGTFADSAIRERLLLAAVDPRVTGAGEDLAGEFARFAEDAWGAELAARPDRSRARAFMGVLLQETGQPQRGVAFLERAAALSPRRRGHYFRLADVYQRTGQAEAALEWAARGYRLDPSRRRSRLWYAAAAVYAGRDDLVEQLLLPVYGTTLVRNEQLSRAYIAAGRTQEVIDGWREMIQRDHLDLQARRGLAEFLLLAGRIDEAETELRTLQLLAGVEPR
jgi:tetratricopeptide (TPR) repeat protein